MRTNIKLELRAPSWGPPVSNLYATAFEIAEFVDRIGVTRINLQEHHGFDDSFLPTPFVMGGGIASRTKQARINLGAVLLPLHDPVDVAEQTAVLDQMSGGRLEVIMGTGYVPWEFQTFHKAMKDRAKLMDENIEIVLRALSGERFEKNGREIFVRPLPVQKPEDIILVGGGVEASAKRAARFGLAFAPTTRGLFDIYDAECRRLDRTPRAKFGPGKVNDIHLSTDPEASWRKLLPHLQHAVGEYSKIVNAAGTRTPFTGLTTDEEVLRKSGILAVWTPEQLIEYARREVDENGSLSFSPLMSGMPAELGWESLKLLEQVMPQLNDLHLEAA
jgi:alkanesulfonate monooxygenase SsuD/methylene tetrahydromethanopterin reductase-like flavin-dependent oxidoreductase (luciferase family)